MDEQIERLRQMGISEQVIQEIVEAVQSFARQTGDTVESNLTFCVDCMANGVAIETLRDWWTS